MLALMALAAVAQQHDQLFDLRRELLDRIEAAYTKGDASTLERMAATERRIDTLKEMDANRLRQLRAVGANAFTICPDGYDYVSGNDTCVPAPSNVSSAGPVSPMLVSVSTPTTVIKPSDDPSIWLPPPGFGPPAISPPNVNVNCTVRNPEVLAAAQACSAAQAEICNSGTAAQCQAKTAECAALWASVSLDCSG